MRTQRSRWTILAMVFLAAAAMLVARPVQAQTYMGCWADTSILDLDAYLERSAQNTPQRCVATCAAKGFVFAAVQNGESCLCGNTYGRYGQSNACSTRCTGDGNQACGGYGANSVYATGLQIVQTPPPTRAADCVPGQGMECDTNRVGSDYAASELAQADPRLCAQACQNDASCRAWTYVRPGVQGANAVCYLKNPAPAAAANGCCVSGTVGRIIDQQYPFEVDTDRRGNDYERFDMPVADPDQCFARCRGDGRCAAWTFVRPGVQGPQAVCYLKNPAPAASASTCCVSGAIAGRDTVSPPVPPPVTPPSAACDWPTSSTYVEQGEGEVRFAWRGVYRRVGGNRVQIAYRHPDGRSLDVGATLEFRANGEILITRDDYPQIGATIDPATNVALGMYQGGSKFTLTCGGQ